MLSGANRQNRRESLSNRMPNIEYCVANMQLSFTSEQRIFDILLVCDSPNSRHTKTFALWNSNSVVVEFPLVLIGPKNNDNTVVETATFSKNMEKTCHIYEFGCSESNAADRFALVQISFEIFA